MEVQSANAKKKKNNDPSVFFVGYRETISWKTYFEWFGKNYPRDYSGIL